MSRKLKKAEYLIKNMHQVQVQKESMQYKMFPLIVKTGSYSHKYLTDKQLRLYKLIN